MRIHSQTAEPQPSLPAIYPELAVHSNEHSVASRDACDSFVTLRRIKSYANKQQMLGGRFAMSKQETPLPKALSVYLSQRLDPVGLKVQRWVTISLREWSADLRVGPAIVRCWSENGKAIYKTVSRRKGICLSSTVRAHCLFSRRITLMISGIVRVPKLCITCSLTVCGMLQITSPAYAACHKGDWRLLRKLLGNGKVKITDTTAYGDTLLHVCAFLSIRLSRC